MLAEVNTITDKDFNHKNLDKLLRTPVRNLEERIRLLESEMKLRSEISRDIQLALGTDIIKQQDVLWRARYLSPHDDTNRRVKESIQSLRKRHEFERVTSWTDVLKLRLRLQETRESLKSAQDRLGLLIPNDLDKQYEDGNFRRDQRDHS